MKKVILAVLLGFFSVSSAQAQCTGNFPTGTACGNVSGAEDTAGPIPTRKVLLAATPFYVRSNGNDTECTGLTNAAYVSGSYPQACAFLTGQGGGARIQTSFDLGGITGHTLNFVNVSGPPQTYSAAGPIFALTGPLVGGAIRNQTTSPAASGCPLIIKSLSGVAADITVNSTGSNTFFADRGGFFCIQDLTATSTIGSIIRVGGSPGGEIDFGNVIFGASAGSKMFSSHGANYEPYGNFSLTGNSPCVFQADFGGMGFISSSLTITQLANFTVSQGFACTYGGTLSYLLPTYTTGGFTVTGPKFTIDGGASLRTGGAVGTPGCASIPGSTAGAQIWGTCDGTADALTSYNAFTVKSLDGSAALGPTFSAFRDSASPAANDLIGKFTFFGRDSANGFQEYGWLQGKILDPTSTSEDGEIAINTVVAGTQADRLTVGQGIQIGAPTGGDKGVGTLNVAGQLYQNNGPIAYASGGTAQDLNTAWSTASPAATCQAGAPTSITTSTRYKQLGKIVFFNMVITLTTINTCTVGLIIPVPVTAVASASITSGANGSTGASLLPLVTSGNISIYSNTGVFPGVNGNTLYVGGNYEAN